MFIAKQKRKENIAEYLLYMWQIEDLIRANNCDIDKIEHNIIDKYNVDYKREESGLVVANIPKTWVKIRAPREMSDEERQKLAERAKARFCK